MGRNDYVLRCHSNKNHWLNIHLQPFIAYYHSNSIASQIRIYPKPTFSVFQVTVKLSCLTGECWIALSTLPSSTSNPFVKQSYEEKKRKETQSHWKTEALGICQSAIIMHMIMISWCFQMTSFLSYCYRIFRVLILKT